MFAAAPVLAQENPVITLDDTTPGIDVVISLPPGTAGAVAMELNQVSATLTDSSGSIAFYMADPRAHALELEFLPDSGTHILTLERLPGVSEGFVMLHPQTGLTSANLAAASAAAEVSASDSLTLNQRYSAALSASQPDGIVAMTVPAQTTGLINAMFANAPIAAQLADDLGSTVASIYGGHIGGLSVAMDSGVYTMTLMNSNPALEGTATVSLTQAPAFALTGLMPAVITAAQVETPIAPAEAPAAQLPAAPAAMETCAITVGPSSINLRSGPGTGYSILWHSFEGYEHMVGGRNSDGSWLLVADNTVGSAWMSSQLGTLNGSCTGLTVYDIPYREAPPQQVIELPAEVITLPAETITVSGGSGSSSSGGGGGGDYEDNDNESSGSGD